MHTICVRHYFHVHTPVSMHFLFTYLISFNNVFFNLRTNKHSIIMANGGLDNICTKIYNLLCCTCMLKKMYTFRENYFCKHLYAFRHNTMSYNNKDYHYFTKRAKLDIMNQCISTVKW